MASYIEQSNGKNNYVAPPISYTYKENAYAQSAGQTTPSATTPNRTINLVTVFDPSTQTTFVYEQKYIPGTTIAAGRTANDIVATAGTNGVYKPTSNASNDLAYLIANDKNLKSNLDKQTRFAITKGITQVEGKPPSSAKVDSTFGRLAGAGSNPNTATPPVTSTDTTGGQESSAERIDLTGVPDIELKGESARQLASSSLKYPLESSINGGNTNKSDYIAFTAIEYGNKGFKDNDIFKLGTRNNKNLGKTVYLPIQPQIVDNNSVRWNEGTLNPLQIAGANIAMGTITNGKAGLEAALTTALRSISDKSTSESLKSLVALYASEQAVQAQLGSRLVGAVLNPNLELLFEAPTLRPFTFNFKLSPRSAEEAQIVKSIIRFFKLNMAPKTTEGNLFLKAPNVFEIRYIYGPTNENHKGINRIKSPCALQALSVDYTPDGSYMTFDEEDEKTKPESMVSYTLSMQFMELEPVYAKDYNTTKDDEIGF